MSGPDIFGASIQSAIHMYPELNKISSSHEDNRLSYRCFIFVLITPLISIAQKKKINYSSVFPLTSFPYSDSTKSSNFPCSNTCDISVPLCTPASNLLQSFIVSHTDYCSGCWNHLFTYIFFIQCRAVLKAVQILLLLKPSADYSVT